MAKNWLRIDKEVLGNNRHFLQDGDECAHAEYYKSHGTYLVGGVNQDIHNFKYVPDERDEKNKQKVYYRGKAIEDFSKILADVLNYDYNICFIPSSTKPGDPGYSNRFELLFENLLVKKPRLKHCQIIFRTETIQKAHSGGKRSPAERVKGLQVDIRTAKQLSHIALIDDLWTCGSTFRGCSDLIKAQNPSIQIFGLFWGRTVNE